VRVVNAIGIGAAFRWLRLGLRDLMAAPLPCLGYGAVVALVSFCIWRSLLETDLAFWALSLSCGFVFIAPMLAMGLYEAGSALEKGERPHLMRMLFVRAALRSDVFYLGLALLLIYLLWGRVAQIVYGLSTYRLHTSVRELLTFAIETSEGHAMLISGAIVGGVMAFFTFAVTVISAPMLLDQNANVFEAMFTSLRSVARNFAPLLLWAALITVLLLACALTSWLALAVVFPWLGLASWRAYRDIVGDEEAPRRAAVT
jgi:uncharacterized membrane protein